MGMAYAEPDKRDETLGLYLTAKYYVIVRNLKETIQLVENFRLSLVLPQDWAAF